MTSSEAIERAEKLFGRPFVLREAARGTPVAQAGITQWFVDAGDDQRLHGFDAHGHLTCEHADCSARERLVDAIAETAATFGDA
jgi:hypothetical protein